ncbi:MAG TPA: efflux RND transporter periplasmic adaptor subunit [Candidatus Acidoferrum sp.]|nr:efflux RND transporter periplasmic adaptor subunit [Candidatus Acidoferrum sp.]
MCWSAALAASLGIAVGLSGCSAPDKEKAPVATVQVTPARVAPIALTISAEAVVSPLQQAIITPKITSTIKKFLVQRGSKVHEGQLLAVLENADLSAAAEQSKGELEQAEAGYDVSTGASIPQDLQKAELDARTAKVNLDAQQKVYDSRKDLYQQGALPRRDLDAAEVTLSQARNQYEVAQRQLEDRKRLGQKQALKSASGQLAAAKGKYLAAQAQLQYSEIRSPIDGVVTERPQFAGELATANQPLLTVMNISKLIAKSHIAQAEAAALKIGNPAEIHVAGLDEPVPGRVTLVSPALDPGSTTVEVWVESVKTNPALKPGISVRVSITAKTLKDALVVPTSALFKNPEGADYVVLGGSDGQAHIKVVQVGIRAAELSQIVSGIKAGDPVISSGGYALPDNTKIKIEEAAASEKDPGDKGGDKSDSSAATPAGKDKE